MLYPTENGMLCPHLNTAECDPSARSDISDDLSTAESIENQKISDYPQHFPDIEQDLVPRKCFGNLHPSNRLRLVEGRLQVIGFSSRPTLIPGNQRQARNVFWEHVVYYLSK